MKLSRGDIYWADLDPIVGSEQGGFRPVIIVQNDVGNYYSPTVIVCAITAKTAKLHLPTHVLLLGGESGLKRNSLVLGEQIRTIEKTRLSERIGSAGADTMKMVDRALQISLGCYPGWERGE